MMHSPFPTEVVSREMLPFPGNHVVDDGRTSTERPDTSLSIGRFLCEVSKLSLELLLQDTRSGLHSLPSEKNKALRLLF